LRINGFHWKADLQGFLNQPGLNVFPFKPPLPADFGAGDLTAAAKAVNGRWRDMQPVRNFFHVHIHSLKIHGYFTSQRFPDFFSPFNYYIGFFSLT